MKKIQKLLYTLIFILFISHLNAFALDFFGGGGGGSIVNEIVTLTSLESPPPCNSGDYKLYADANDKLIYKCQDGVITIIGDPTSSINDVCGVGCTITDKILKICRPGVDSCWYFEVPVSGDAIVEVCNQARTSCTSLNRRQRTGSTPAFINQNNETCYTEDATGLRTFTGTGACDKPSSSIDFVFDGGGAAIAANSKVRFRVGTTGVITGWEILCDVSGSIVFDIWIDTYANAPPTVADTITASDKPTVTSATKAQDLAPTGWTTTLTKGTWGIVNVDSATTVTNCTLSLHYEKNID